MTRTGSHNDKARVASCNYGELGLQLPAVGGAIECAAHANYTTLAAVFSER